MHSNAQKGFTLIELLVVIAIIAVLSVVVILTLNPAEILRQARDSSRVSDMATLKSGLSLFLADVVTSTVGAGALGSGATCYYYSTATFTTTTCPWVRPSVGGVTGVNSRTVNGGGWIPVNFNAISAGSPFGNLPVDPVNSGNSFYGYTNSSTTTAFKLGVKMESSKYGNGGSGDVVSTDGGQDNSTYETGTNVTL
jgi:prepilin-type N-terminal cleavage/methylation domain-containing protein